MMYNTDYNFYEVVDSAEAYFANHDKGKGSGWKGYQRWKHENESKYYPSGDRKNADHYLPANQYKEIKKNQRLAFKGSFDNGWQELGPWNVNNVTSHYSPGIGRVETFWVNPSDSNHMYMGSRSGGFWRTTDGGANWENTTDFLVASGVFSIAVNPANSNEVLIAVQQGGNGYTHGIYKSTDGGKTWATTNFGPSKLGWIGLGDNEKIYKIAYHPTEAGYIYIGTTKGLFISKTNLSTYTGIFTGRVTDIEFHPTKANIVYAYNNNGNDRNYLKKSIDYGDNFSNAGFLTINNNAKLHIAVSPAAPNNVYLASTSGVWRSTNEGLSFSFRSNPDENCLGFAVSDEDVNYMVYGYVDTEASSDEGKTFDQVTKWSVQDAAYVHADIRAAECINGTFYMGTDGFLVKSNDNGTTWTILNNGTGIREFYAVGLCQGNDQIQMLGSQDNGTSILSENGWIEWNGGDGMEALVHPLNKNWMIGSWQYGSRNVTTNGGRTRVYSGNPEKGSEEASWEAPLLLNPLDHMKVYHFSDEMFEGANFGREWTLKGSPVLGQIIDAAIAENNDKIIAIARYTALNLTTDGGNTWKNIVSGLPSYYITDIAFDPKRDSTILVTYNRYQSDNKKVYISKDLGSTWTNISYNLNNMPLRTVVVDQSDSSYIYVGGEIGVYYKSMNGTQWTLYDNKMPNVTVKDLEIHHGSNTLRAATWGRGLWEYTLVGKNDHPSITTTEISHIPHEESPKVGNPQFVTCNIETEAGLKSAKVYYSIDNIKLNQSISMSNESGNIWKSNDGIISTKLNSLVYFKVVAEDVNGNISETYRFNYRNKVYGYCNAIGSVNTGGDYINYVKVGDFVNSSGQDFYGDFVSKQIKLTEENEYDIKIGLNTHFDEDTISAWIDFNNDLEFSNEEQITMSSIDNDHFAYGKFTLPQSAVNDILVRMRVRSQYFNEPPIPCGERTGEVEDYSVLISRDPSSGIEEHQAIFKLHPNPSNGKFTIELNKNYPKVVVNIYNAEGKIVSSKEHTSSQSINIKESLSNGLYMVEVNADQHSSRKKLIISE